MDRPSADFLLFPLQGRTFRSWFEGLEEMSLEAGLALYIDRSMSYCRKYPYAVRVFLLNVVQAQDTEIFPGYQAIRTFFKQTITLLKDRLPIQASDRDIEIFRQSFNTLALSYLGASSYYAGILGMDANSREYEEWIRDMLMDLFLPRLKQLLA